MAYQAEVIPSANAWRPYLRPRPSPAERLVSVARASFIDSRGKTLFPGRCKKQLDVLLHSMIQGARFRLSGQTTLAKRANCRRPALSDSLPLHTRERIRKDYKMRMNNLR